MILFEPQWSCLSVWPDFQLGDKPIGALELCSTPEDNDPVAKKSELTKTPCILRRRRKRLYTKKSVVQQTKSSSNASSSSPSVVVSRHCSQVSETDSSVTPKKENSEHILTFSPSQV